jgi:hypothetical protein
MEIVIQFRLCEHCFRESVQIFVDGHKSRGLFYALMIIKGRRGRFGLVTNIEWKMFAIKGRRRLAFKGKLRLHGCVENFKTSSFVYFSQDEGHTCCG